MNKSLIFLSLMGALAVCQGSGAPVQAAQNGASLQWTTLLPVNAGRVAAPKTNALPPSSGQETMTQTEIAAATATTLEQQVLARINRIRQSKGLARLRFNPRLTRVARRHSHNMLRQSFFSHTDRNGNSVVDRVQHAGIPFRVVAENLAWNSNSPDPVNRAVTGWMGSSGHRRNILNSKVKETGVGIVRQGNTYFFTQVFIRQQ